MNTLKIKYKAPVAKTIVRQTACEIQRMQQRMPERKAETEAENDPHMDP